MAGESAKHVAQGQRDKSERLSRLADLWESGTEGEEETARELDVLVDQGWTVWHDLAWPGRARATIDHLLVGPGGVFVIDSKNWSGRISVKDDVVRQNGRRRESAVLEAEQAALAISQALGYQSATGVLCFVRDEPIRGWAREAMVCSTATLVEMITALPAVLQPASVQRFTTRVEQSLQPATAQGPVVSVPTQRTASMTTPAVEESKPKRVSKLGRAWPQLLVAAVLLGVGLLVGPRIASWVADQFEEESSATTEVGVGDTQTTAVTNGQLGLDVTLVGVETATGQPGRHVVTVRVDFANGDDRRWVAPAPPSVELATSERTFRPRGQAGGLSLAVGQNVERVARFVLPASAEPTAVRVTVGDSTLTWVL